MSRYVFPAIFHAEDGGFWVEFPDLPGCYTCGDDLADAIYMAQNALAGYLSRQEETGRAIPVPSPIAAIPCPEAAIISLVLGDTAGFRFPKLTAVYALTEMRLLAVFDNGIVKLFDVRSILKEYPEYSALEDPALFAAVRLEAGGYGVAWSPELDASEGELWQNGTVLPLRGEALHAFISENAAPGATACSQPHAPNAETRQALDDARQGRNLVGPFDSVSAMMEALNSDS